MMGAFLPDGVGGGKVEKEDVVEFDGFSGDNRSPDAALVSGYMN